MAEKTGLYSVKFKNLVNIKAVSSVVGTKEGEGPLKDCFDILVNDNLYGEKTWEKAEARFVKKSITEVIKKASLKDREIDYILAGDLQNQAAASCYGIKTFERPFFGLYGACSTFGESLSLGAALIDGCWGQNIVCEASSHFCAAEKQFRFPLEFGNQRPQTSTWTVTGAGAAVLSKAESPVVITGITTEKIVDLGITDANNMGAAMAPAAADIILNHFKDFGSQPEDYDKIFTGDLGSVGRELLIKLLKEKGYDISQNHLDCGMLIYDGKKQDTHAGGSGCACSAAVFSMIFKKLLESKYKKILFIPTGALMSPTSVMQGENIMGICHLLRIERRA
ncbi:MAG: stage V sporulation protein AD [Clostridiales bacterium]|nr:stage V sporulation protein AD [Clostridiales bacterium]